MKTISLILFLFCICITEKIYSQQTDADLAIEWLKYLSHDKQKGRFTGTIEHLRLGDSIAHYFERIGLHQHPLIGSYKQPVQVELSQVKTTSYNIVGWIPGTKYPEEYIFITAHYDHLGTTRTNPNPSFNQKEQIMYKDSIFNGANDNATGTAAVLTLAKYFTEHPPQKSILFICFTAEELGLIGSWNMPFLFKEHSIQAVVNIEMIGRTLSKKNNNPYLTGYEYSNLGEILNESLYQVNPKKYGIRHIQKDPFFTHKLFMRSDNYNFAKLGIPAHTIISSKPTDKYYHHVKDDFDSIDLKHFTQTIETIKNSLIYLVNTSPAPSKINTLLLPEQ